MTEKVSLAKLMNAKGPWEGPANGQTYYGISPHESPTGGGLVVDNNQWPVAFVKPKVLRPHTDNGTIDIGGVVTNAFGPESINRHVPITDTRQTSSGLENEFRLVGVKVSQEMHDTIKATCDASCGGYTTPEVASDMIEANRPVVTNATFQEIAATTEEHTRVIIKTVEEMGGKVIMVSSRPNTNKDVTSAPDVYVDAMVSLLAEGFLNLDSEPTMEWISHTSASMLNNLSPAEIVTLAQTDHAFARRLVLEFDASAIHAHVRTNEQEPNPHFYAFHMNHEMGVIGPAMSVHTLSGPFRNGTYFRLHDNKLIHRLLFKTAGYQPPFHPMGSKEYLDEASRNATHGAASSLTRAGITGDRSHGEGRIRTEPFRTDERLFGSAHSLPEVEACFAFAGNVNAAILSHYYVGDGKGNVPDHARPFYCEPNPHRYHINRLQFAAHGPFSTMIDGVGKAVPYDEFIKGYATFVTSEFERLGISDADRDMEQFTIWLVKPVEIPTEGWNVKNYHDKNHPDYGKGTLSTHLIAELAVKVTGESKWRTHYRAADGNWVRVETYNDARLWWKTLNESNVLPEGNYEQQIEVIVDDLANAVHNRYL